jgi:hypothetical protein
VGEDVQNKHTLCLVVDPGNQPVLISVDIEHGSSTHNVCMREVTSYVDQRSPVGTSGNPVPVQQRHQRIPMLFGKPENGWLTDHPHTLSLQNVNPGVKWDAELHASIMIEVFRTDNWHTVGYAPGQAIVRAN